MRFLTWALVLPVAVMGTAFVAAELQRPAAVQSVVLNGHTFTLPVGFEIELVAGPPLVNRPIVADFDEQGRLYVADSSGSNDKVAIQLEKKPHRIVRLEDSKGGGRFDRATVFADNMMFPEGALWYDGSLYVAAPPSIWKLTDTTGSGVANQRTEWFKGKTLTGCANDLHGPYLGPDGWIYWCKGAFAEQTYQRPGRPPLVTKAAHIFRSRPDGSGIEPVMTGGMDNPVEVVFTPGGERIFTTTFLQRPGGGLRDGLIHAIYGGIYGKEHAAVLDSHPHTSPALMPVLVHLGPAAPAGLTRYEGQAFGSEYRDNLFAALFNMHKVTRHVLTESGSTFAARTEDFLVSNNLDFHPTDVLEDADGSLLVIDTGGWYKLCCPTSQLHKPDVLGAIYRIRRQGAARPDDPRGLQLPWATMTAGELTALLDDSRPAVRRRAIQALAAKEETALPAIKRALRPLLQSVEARRNAVWAATRIDAPRARMIARKALTDTDETVRQTAIHSASVRRDADAVPALLELLRGPSLHNRRAAAEALGRIGDKSAVPALLSALAGQNDRVLEHSLTFALIEIADKEGLASGLKSGNIRVRRAALTALDQINGLEPQTIAGVLTTNDPVMRETAAWIAERHPEWGGALAGFLRDRLAARSFSPAQREELVRQLARFARTPAIQELLAERLRSAANMRPACQVALQAMAGAGLKEAPDTWIAAITGIVAGGDKDLISDAVGTARALPIPKGKAEKLSAALLALGSNDKAPVPVRLMALAAIPGGLPEVTAALFAFVRGELDREKPVVERALAVDVLARARLSNDQLIALTESLKNVGPMEVRQLLDAFGQSKDDRVGQQLVAALGAPSVRSGLSVGMLKPRLTQFSPRVRQQAEELYALLDADTAKQKSRLTQLLTSLKDGDIRRGQAVFNSARAACSACHAVGYMGGKVGPDLTRIGSIRSERDLLEAIVFPSASFVRSFEPVLILTRGGKAHNGLILRESPDEVILATGPNQQVRIARTDIEEIQPSKVSVMPAGLDQQMTARELADLVAFLKACK